MLSFSQLLSTKSTTKSAKATSLTVGDVIHPTVRSDGGKGLVLVLGRMASADGKYASKKNPIHISVEILTKGGEKTQETLQMTDADGVHLGETDRAAVDAMIANIESMTVKEVK